MAYAGVCVYRLYRFILGSFLCPGGKSPSNHIHVNGVTQVGVLGVALFTVATDDFEDGLSAAIGRSLSWVTGQSMWCALASARHIAGQLQLTMTRLEQWSWENYLNFSTARLSFAALMSPPLHRPSY